MNTIIDTDDNGIPDKVEYYKTGDDEPTLQAGDIVIEEALRPATNKFLNAIRGEFSIKIRCVLLFCGKMRY